MIRTFILMLLSAAVAGASAAEQPAVLDTLVVCAEQVGADLMPVAPCDELDDLFASGPFAMIRRGAASCTDLYLDGFKKSDIVVTLDGERFTTACPNRMDTRAGHVNLLDVEAVEASRGGAGLQSGLAGTLNFRRRAPGEALRTSGRLSGAFDASEELDAALSVEAARTRVSARHRRSEPWTDGDGGTFRGRYGFARTPASEVTELQAVHAFEGGDAVATYEHAAELLFPYLLMDERENDHYQASVSTAGLRLYFNRNEHLMDNALRSSASMTDMSTYAVNTMVGLVGPWYEGYARNWDADNRITPLANPAMGKVNAMLPNVARYYASANHGVEAGGWILAGRIGLARTQALDESGMALYRRAHDVEDPVRWHVPFGATASREETLAGGLLELTAEVSSEAPSVEQLFINVDKPGSKPDWIGNPELGAPVRGVLRAGWRRSGLRAEAFAARVNAYPYLVRVADGAAQYQTYDAVDAMLYGAELGWNHDLLDIALNWNRGEKTGGGGPLAEIRPLMLTAEARTPRWSGARLLVRYQHAAEQDRVDATLGETVTSAWDQIDLGLDWEGAGWALAVDLENVADEAYARHLSYLRNPFSAGAEVLEPGRTLRATYAFDF